MKATYSFVFKVEAHGLSSIDPIRCSCKVFTTRLFRNILCFLPSRIVIELLNNLDKQKLPDEDNETDLILLQEHLMHYHLPRMTSSDDRGQSSFSFCAEESETPWVITWLEEPNVFPGFFHRIVTLL